MKMSIPNLSKLIMSPELTVRANGSINLPTVPLCVTRPQSGTQTPQPSPTDVTARSNAPRQAKSKVHVYKYDN